MGPLAFAFLVTSKPQVSIRLAAPKAVYRSGEEVVMSATAKNLTNETIELVTEQDSMNWGRKAPYCVLESQQANGKWEPLIMKDVMRCGNANPLRAEDFMTIAPGKMGEILQGMRWSKYEVNQCLKEPGTYRIRLRYDSTPNFERWLGGPLMPEQEQKAMSDLKPHFDRTPKGVFISNEVTIKVQ